MDHAPSTRILALSAAATFVALGACSPAKNNTATTDTTAVAAPSSTSARATDTAVSAGNVSATGKKNWSDANIFALLSAANRGEIEEGRLAERKALNPQVKAFARRMVTDHTKLLNEGQAMAKKLNVTPVYPQGNDLTKDNANELKDLNTKKAGRDWDEDYLGKQIDDHKKTVDLINDAIKATQNTQIQNMLQTALPTVQAHLDAAQALKDKVKA